MCHCYVHVYFDLFLSFVEAFIEATVLGSICSGLKELQEANKETQSASHNLKHSNQN